MDLQSDSQESDSQEWQYRESDSKESDSQELDSRESDSRSSKSWESMFGRLGNPSTEKISIKIKVWEPTSHDFPN